uniref:Peptidase S54 rhomboid domain-containing protein n=2 Tax=Lygus hesperus TaxID=30085 RepID=A0A0K8SJN0_LYGHE
MRRDQRRQRGLELGVLLLIGEVLNIGYDAIPPVTLVSIIGQALLYIGVINVPWEKWDVCISGKKVLHHHDYKSFFLSNVEHADDMHLYYNMISYLVKGRTLEYKYGSANFALLLAFLSTLTSFFYVAIAYVAAEFLENKHAMSSCAIGFSGVIFALKLLTTLENPVGHTYIQGFRVHVKYAAWAELVAIHVLVPNASFMGHLAGILAGLVYFKTPLRSVVDYLLSNFTGHPMRHGTHSSEYSRYYDDYDYYEERDNSYRQSSYSNRYQQPYRRPNNFGWRF